LSSLIPELDAVRSGYDWWTGDFTTNNELVKVRLSFERIADGDNGAIWCEAQAWVIIKDDLKSVIPPSRTNLMNGSRGGSGWKSLVSTLEDMSSEIRWDEAVATAVEAAIELYRTGDREIALEYIGADRGHPFLLEPFIASSGVSVFYGEGGTGKSLIALGMSASIASGLPIFGQYPRKVGPVVYFDYEDDNSVHSERLEAILKQTGELKYPIYHRSLIAKVSQSQATMRRTIGETGAVMAVLDSIGMGRGGNANTAEDTIRLFRALRSLEVPVLAIDHVTKEDKRSGEAITPYGSVYTINSARLLWGGVEVEGTTKPGVKNINLINTKANRTALSEPLGLEVTYKNKEDSATNTRWLEEVTFEMFDRWWGTTTPDVWQRVSGFLMINPDTQWTIAELSLSMDIDKPAIEKALQRHNKEITRTKVGRAYGYQLTDKIRRQLELEEDNVIPLAADQGDA